MTRFFVFRGLTARVISLLVNLSVCDALAIDRPIWVAAPAKPAPPRALRPASETTAVEVASNVRVRMGGPLPVSVEEPHCDFWSHSSRPDMTISHCHPCRTRQLGEPHRPARMELLGGNADLCPESELLAVGEAG